MRVVVHLRCHFECLTPLLVIEFGRVHLNQPFLFGLREEHSLGSWYFSQLHIPLTGCLVFFRSDALSVNSLTLHLSDRLRTGKAHVLLIADLRDSGRLLLLHAFTWSSHIEVLLLRYLQFRRTFRSFGNKFPASLEDHSLSCSHLIERVYICGGKATSIVS